jgi:hypothetical protein
VVGMVAGRVAPSASQPQVAGGIVAAMGYRSVLEASVESVQDTTLAATRRLDEAIALFVQGRYHAAIYLGGLAAEMFLKTACFLLEGAKLADPVAAYLDPVKSKKYEPPFKSDYESGHGLWFWSQELLLRRSSRRKRFPNRFLQVMASLYADWYIGMRYRPGMATVDDAAGFLQNVEWLANNHLALRT